MESRQRFTSSRQHRNAAFPAEEVSMREPRESRSLLALAGFGLATAATAWYGSRQSSRKKPRNWYRNLDKPNFTPPDAAFPIVWTGLYGLMAWSGWRIWSAPPSRERTRALRLWAAQLATNAKWSKLFFGDQRPGLSLVDAIVLEMEIASYITQAWKVDSAAALAFVPYSAWVGFATVLNGEILRRNPDAADGISGWIEGNGREPNGHPLLHLIQDLISVVK
jgi:translocator protein